MVSLCASLQLTRLKQTFPGFDYNVDVNADGRLSQVVWVTPRCKERLDKFGDVLWIDATFLHTESGFCAFLPSVIDGNRKLHRVAYSLATIERDHAIQFLLASIQQFSPSWSGPVTIFKDAKCSAEAVRQAFPLDRRHQVFVHICFWHFFVQDLPKNLQHNPKYEEIKSYVTKLKQARSEGECQQIWTDMQTLFDEKSMKYLSWWYDIRQTWVTAWTRNMVTLGYQASSPSESSNSGFKSWLDGPSSFVEILYTRLL